MPSSSNITAALLDYAPQNSSDLLSVMYQGMDVWNDVTVLPDVKNKIRLTTLLVDSILKPYTSTFTPSLQKINFKPRDIGVDVGKADLLLDPEEYRQTYLAEFTKKGVQRSPEDLPFEQYVWEAIFAKFGEDVNNVAAYFGVHNAGGSAPVDVCDGFGTKLAAMITASEVTPNSVGALVKTTAQDQLLTIWRSIPEKFRVKKLQMTAYMSQDSYDAYEDGQDTKSYNNGLGESFLGPKYLRHTSGMLELRPVSWMSGSDRVIITPKSNIIMAADATEMDLAKMNIVPDVWTAKVGIAAAFGFDFRYAGYIWCNEVV